MINKTIKKNINSIKDFPKKGIIFRDITSLLNNKKVFSKIINSISIYAKKNGINKIIGVESRGFIFASPVAFKNKIPLVLIRKKGKLPRSVFKARYDLEYGIDELNIHKDSIKKNDRVLVVDDLIATGGTAIACEKLIKKTNIKKINFIFVIELSDLKGSKKIKNLGHNFKSLCSFSEDEKWI